MIELPRPAVVYDAGALVAADRGDDRFRDVHLRYIRQFIRPLVPSPVLTQVWRDGSKQARLSRALRGCSVEPTSDAIARKAGVLLGKSKTSDAVDAIVVATAIERLALIVTGDPDDISHLWTSSRPSRKLAVLAI